jgi:MFS family permease
LDTRRSVVALLASLLTSSMATATLDTVLGIQVFDISGRPLDLGLLGLAAFAPSVLFVLVTGSVADRFDRRWVVAWAHVVQATCAAALFVYLAHEPTTVVPIFAVAFVFGLARAFADPPARALPADIVPPERVPWVVARSSVTWQIATILGPVLGGFLFAANTRLPYVAVFVFFLVSGALVLAVHPVPPRFVRERVDDETDASPTTHMTARARLTEAVEGFRFIRSRPIVLGAISLDLFAVLFGGAVALLPALADERLGVGAVGIGWLRAAGGIGAASVTLWLAVRPLRRHVGRRLLTSVATFGVATIVLGATRHFAVAFVALLVLAGADSISVFVRATLVPLVTPRSKRGRVLAVESVFIGASNELGAFESGVAGQILGPGGAVVLGGAATLAVALGWARAFPALRNVDRFPRPQDEPA